MRLFLWLITSYLIGSVPTGYLMGKFLKGMDIREHGSGNPGAANVFRVVGKSAGLFTLLADGVKGYLPAQLALDSQLGIASACSIGMAAIAGHNWTIFLNFKGGKGVATTTGVFLALLPVPTFIAVAVFLAAVLGTRHVSVGSMLGALSFALSSWFFSSSVLLNLFANFSAALIIFLHKKNIQRLFHKEEPKISWKKFAS